MYAIYGNIYHQYTPNVSIYTSTMDPMGYNFIYSIGVSVWCQFHLEWDLGCFVTLRNSTTEKLRASRRTFLYSKCRSHPNLKCGLLCQNHLVRSPENSLGFTMFHHYKIKGYNMCVCIHKKAKSACSVSNIHSPIHPYGIRYDPILMFWQEVRWSLWQLGNLTPSPQHFQPLGVHHPAGGSGLVTGAPATAHLKTSLPCPSGSQFPDKCTNRCTEHLSYPIGSMYGIYANIGGILMINVTIYSIHGSYGYISDIFWYCIIWHLFPEVSSPFPSGRVLGLCQFTNWKMPT